MNAPVTRAAEGLARRAFTVAEVRRMVEAGVIPEDERLEILGGEIIPMSPKGVRHEALKGALNSRWVRACPNGFVVMPETGLYLDERTYLEPDFIIYRKGVGLAQVTGADVLLAVEIADSSLDYDLGRKSRIYAEHGVKELWVIDAAKRLVHVHVGPAPGGYAWVNVREAADPLLPTASPPEFALALDDLEAL